MIDVLSIADLIRSNADNISTFFIIAALIAAFAVGIAEYKSKLWEYITNRRNRFWFIYDLLMFAARGCGHNPGHFDICKQVCQEDKDIQKNK